MTQSTIPPCCLCLSTTVSPVFVSGLLTELLLWLISYSNLELTVRWSIHQKHKLAMMTFGEGIVSLHNSPSLFLSFPSLDWGWSASRSKWRKKKTAAKVHKQTQYSSNSSSAVASGCLFWRFSSLCNLRRESLVAAYCSRRSESWYCTPTDSAWSGSRVACRASCR